MCVFVLLDMSLQGHFLVSTHFLPVKYRRHICGSKVAFKFYAQEKPGTDTITHRLVVFVEFANKNHLCEEKYGARSTCVIVFHRQYHIHHHEVGKLCYRGRNPFITVPTCSQYCNHLKKSSHNPASHRLRPNTRACAWACARACLQTPF